MSNISYIFFLRVKLIYENHPPVTNRVKLQVCTLLHEVNMHAGGCECCFILNRTHTWWALLMFICERRYIIRLNSCTIFINLYIKLRRSRDSLCTLLVCMLVLRFIMSFSAAVTLGR